jgi:hypothetical protein
MGGIHRIGSAVLAVVLLSTGCSGDNGEAAADAGRSDAAADAATTDGAPDAEVTDGVVPDGLSGDGDTPCAPGYKGDSTWTYELTAEADAPYCVLGAGTTLWERLQNKAELRFVPGRYKLPDAEGDFTLTLPLCLTRPGEFSKITDAGSLSVTFTDWGGSRHKQFAYRQPLSLNGTSWTLESNWSVFQQTGQPNPQLIIDDQLVRGTNPDSESRYALCPNGVCDDRWAIYPCGENDTARSTTVTFARGTATFHASLVEGLFGAGGTVAGLWRAQGTLDGTSFGQTDYYKLAHQPDHHNIHGGFLVRFDQPIGGACGLEVHAPSTDGSFIYDQLEGWTIDCDGNQLQALDGLAVQSI